MKTRNEVQYRFQWLSAVMIFDKLSWCCNQAERRMLYSQTSDCLRAELLRWVLWQTLCGWTLNRLEFDVRYIIVIVCRQWDVMDSEIAMLHAKLSSHDRDLHPKVIQSLHIFFTQCRGCQDTAT
jgi:hypothetical protein